MFEPRARERFEAAVMGAGGTALRSKQAATASASVPERAHIRGRSGRPVLSTPPRCYTP